MNKIRFTMVELIIAIAFMLVMGLLGGSCVAGCYSCYHVTRLHNKTGKSYPQLLGEEVHSIKENFKKGYERQED